MGHLGNDLILGHYIHISVLGHLRNILLGYILILGNIFILGDVIDIVNIVNLVVVLRYWIFFFDLVIKEKNEGDNVNDSNQENKVKISNVVIEKNDNGDDDKKNEIVEEKKKK